MVDISVRHTKVSNKADDADTSLVRPSDWNAAHTIVNGTGLATEASVTALHGPPIVLLTSGQSNPKNRVSLTWTPAANAFLWNWDLVDAHVGTAFAALASTSITVMDKFASDVALAHPGRNVYLVNIAISSLEISHWMSGTSAPDMYANVKNNIEAALTVLGVTKIDGFAWWQGESQTSEPTLYVDNFASVFTRFAAETWWPRTTPMLFFGIAPTTISGIIATDITNADLQTIVRADPDYRRFVYTGSLPASFWTDIFHPTPAGYFAAGAMAANEYLHGATRDALIDPLRGVLRGNVLGRPYSRNMVVGGNFTTNQWRLGTSFTSVANGAFTADKWVYNKSGAGVVDIAKTSDAPTIAQAGIFTQHCLDVAVTTADASLASTDIYCITHQVDGLNAAFLGFGQAGSRYVTLSFWVKSTKIGAFFVSVRNSAVDRVYTTSYTVDVTNTWEKKRIVIPVDVTGTWLYTVGTTGISVLFTLAAGSDFQFGTDFWHTGDVRAGASQVNAMDSTSNHFKLALVQFEEGVGVSHFEREPGGQVLDIGNFVANTRYPNLRYILVGVNANSVADNPITITLPNGATRYRVASIIAINTGTTASLTTAQYGIFSAATGGGTAYVAAGAVLTGLTATGTGVAGAFAALTNVGATIIFASGTQYFFRITQAQGAAATIDVVFNIEAYP